MTTHRFVVGDKVIFTNIFGVCWGVKTITALDERNGPTYHYEPTDTPWFSTAEENLQLADETDIEISEMEIHPLVDDLAECDVKWAYFQQRYGFTPTETYGCW
jgi:hypothetical protein